MGKRIPDFKTEEEEARFWDENDSTEFDLEPANEFQLSPELEEKILTRRELKKPVTLRLEPNQITEVKRIANKKGIPYQTLIRMWIVEKIENELVHL